jgi:hypothetical protein
MTKLPKNTQIKNNVPGEPLWLSGKVMEWENKWNQKIPGSLPSPPSNLGKKE